jgi:cystathionine beta-lyase/cystathionine gamma-synthase
MANGYRCAWWGGGAAEAVEICGRTRLFTLGESLGGVESLIEHPTLNAVQRGQSLPFCQMR